MVGTYHVIIVLLFVRFSLCQICDCKLVDILRNIVQKEMMEREILASRVDMLESLLGSGTKNVASSSTISSEAVILERLGELETTTENIKTQLKDITTERQKEARLNTALIKAWGVHKLGFSNLTEDIKQSSSDNNKSFHNLLTDIDKSMRLFEYKFEELLNKSKNEETKQQQEVEVQFDTIRFDLNTTFNDYKSRMDTDMMVFINKTEKQLHDIRAEIITDKCASNPCMNGATCLDGVQRYICICMDGYIGTNCQIEIDECSSNPCMNGATCVDAIDGYSCRCQAGYLYAGNSCQIQIDECSSSPCLNGATCVDELNNYTCRCVAGYSGLNCQTEIDECSSSPCINGATCVDELNSYTCRCVAGYSGLNCQTDINECSSNPCMNGAACVDGLSNYSCTCMAGYSGVNCQIVSVCNEALTGPAGEITSPNYPNEYPSNTYCYHRISVATGHRVRIVILHFFLEPGYDFLKIYDGADTSSTMMAEMTGRSLPAVTTYISTTNVMLLRFTTDHDIGYSGFRLQYSEV